MPCRLRDRVAAAVLLSIFPLAQVSSLSAQATGVTSNPRPPGVTPIRAAPRAATIDDLLAIKAVSDVAISPDGRWIAYVVTTRDAESNLNKSDVWLVGADGAPVPVGGFAVGTAGTAAFTTAATSTAEGVVVALTLEPRPGATTPTLPLVAAGTARPAS